MLAIKEDSNDPITSLSINVVFNPQKSNNAECLTIKLLEFKQLASLTLRFSYRGFGVERIAMIKNKVEDIRKLVYPEIMNDGMA